MAHSHKASDPQRLLHLLDCHNVTLREWLVMAALDHGPRDKLVSCLPRWAAESGQTYFGVIASEEECRTGLEACLRYGWLRIMDQHAIEEVHAFLRDDPVLVPRPSAVVAGQGELDFTPCGAMPYRMIAAEWPCPYWEDNICVWKESYREEHRYCEAKEVLQGIVQQYAAGAEVVRASRVVPIGPWCVYWWQQFPAGYRLELEIGDL